MTAVTESPTRAPRLATFGPNWFASVMGTGIVANALVTLPHHPQWSKPIAVAIWLLSACVLLIVSVTTILHWLRHTDRARSHANNPAMAPFYGAPAMAFMTVGAGTLLAGSEVVGIHNAVVIDAILWSIGTALGLATAVSIPFLQFTRHQLERNDTVAAWLMPVVPPMVSAATGALLVPHAAEGELRTDLFYGCFAMFGLSLVASLVIITMMWSKLTYSNEGQSKLVPTLWIMLGPLGQSITAMHLLTNSAPHVVAPELVAPLQTIALVYGMATFGFAALWFSIAAAITIRTARQHLPFSLTWWSFTFPVGTCVTGTTGIALRTGSVGLSYLADALFAFLVIAWIIVAIRTIRGAHSGALFV